jgi:hypothetical protein
MLMLANPSETDYLHAMKTDPTTRSRLVPHGTPFSKAEQAEWDALSEEERLRIYQEMFDSPDCNTYVDETMDEILAAAKARLATRHG